MRTHSSSPRIVYGAGLLLNVVLLIAGVALFSSGSSLVRHWVQEDGFIEWLQFICFVALSAFLVLAALERWLENGSTREVVVLLLLGGLVAGAAVEEVSWFQRVIGVESPEFFQKHNRQTELNLHNLTVGGVNLNKGILVKLIFVIGLVHNLVLPLLAKRSPAVRERVDAWGLYLPPLWAGVAYLVLAILAQTLIGHPRRGELSEVIGAVHYLGTAFAAYGFGASYTRPPLFTTAGEQGRMARLYVFGLLFFVLVSGLLGAGYLGRTPL